MKKILFCLQTMVLGGVENELITVLNSLDRTQFQVTVLLLYIDNSEIVQKIPDWVHLINLDVDKNYFCSGVVKMSIARFKQGLIIEAVGLLAKRLLNIGMTQSNQSLTRIRNMEEQYDVAICYHIHSPLMLKYVAEKVNAKKKIGWIHNDFLTTGYRIQNVKNILSYYEEFIAVSNAVREEFIALCPKYGINTSVIHNIVDENEIRELANIVLDDTYSYFSDDRIKLLTVGRFTEQKGFDIAIEICERIRNQGFQFCWYMIGWGPDEQKLKRMITERKLEDCAVILGQQNNPFPYIDQCDIYIQPSRHEAWGLVVHEARILHKPIICTHFAGADEQIQDGETGYIVPLRDMDRLTETICNLISNDKDRKRLSNNLFNQSNNDIGIEEISSRFKE